MIFLIHAEETSSTSPRLCNIVEIIGAACARRHHRADIVRQPKPTLNRPRTPFSEVVSFRHEKRNIRRQAIILPRLYHVIDPFRFVVERCPIAAFPRAHAWIMLKRKESEVLQIVMSLQII